MTNGTMEANIVERCIAGVPTGFYNSLAMRGAESLPEEAKWWAQSLSLDWDALLRRVEEVLGKRSPMFLGVCLMFCALLRRDEAAGGELRRALASLETSRIWSVVGEYQREQESFTAFTRLFLIQKTSGLCDFLFLREYRKGAFFKYGPFEHGALVALETVRRLTTGVGKGASEEIAPEYVN